ncbi:MAG: ribosome biogenesis GTPase Der, partial [Firmicutes bacterium]|nr:ribosome biogenesis GTPase Der [Bacillota bacterium]
GRQCEEVVKVANKVYNNASQRISTGTLNQILQDAFRLVQPPSDKGKRLKLLYATQTKTNPPTFKLFVNSRELAQDSYVKYIENFIRKAKDFMGTPIRIELTNRNEENVYG